MDAQEIFYRITRWLNGRPIRLGELPPDEQATFFLTGPDLIERIVRAIELNQSVVLSGPRGCGKSHCIDAAIKKAIERDIIQGHVFLQGNREIPRDYLIEDEISFNVENVDGKKQVIPVLRKSPLFRYADRDDVKGRPIKESGDKVRCVVGPDKKPCKRFALFLDEINRFSDGVLDSLLSVLEERKAVMAGEEYVLPVVVCMTMNPPGYDGSARKLSPPLAARIGRTYRLSTADLDTLGDQIILSKMRKMAADYHATRLGLLREDPTRKIPEFPDVPMQLIRKVGLVTLLCWGDISGKKAGSEYLTPSTQGLLREVMKKDQIVRSCMVSLTDLCQFGPDGRAGADWLTTAIGVALSEAERKRMKKAVLRSEHLVATVLESVAHKIYDSFSQASRPDLTTRKERAVETICKQVFNRPFFTDLVERVADDGEKLHAAFATRLHVDPAVLQGAFMDAGVVADRDVHRWLDVAGQLDAGAKNLLQVLEANAFLVPADPDASLLAGFARAGDDTLAQKFKDMPGPLGTELKRLFEMRPPSIGPRRATLNEEVAQSYAARCIGVETVLKVCAAHQIGTRPLVHIVVRKMDSLWALHLRADTPHAPPGAAGVDPAAEAEWQRTGYYSRCKRSPYFAAGTRFMTELNDLVRQWRAKNTQEKDPAPALLRAIRELLPPMLGVIARVREPEAWAYRDFFDHVRDQLSMHEQVAKQRARR